MSEFGNFSVIALGGGLGRPRRSGIPLQKERGSGLYCERLFVFLLPSLLIELKSLRVIRCFVSYQGHDYPQQLILDIIQGHGLMLASLYEPFIVDSDLWIEHLCNAGALGQQ